MSLQLPLALGLKREFDFATFEPGDNGEVLNALQQGLRRNQEKYLYLWGNSASGKTHLLLAACNLVDKQGDSVVYIPLGRVDQLATTLLDELEQISLVCLDDIDRVAGRKKWEVALFDLFNRIREQGGRLLVSANQPLSALAIELADLRSRLSWGPGYHLRPLDDAGRLLALIRMADSYGMVLNKDTARYLLHHCARDMHFLAALVERLDRASIVAGRRLTIPFVRMVLEQMKKAPPETGS